METRLGQAAPRVVAMEAILAACPLVAEVEAVAEGPCEGPWLLVMPRRSLSLRASPGGLLVPVGCPVLSGPGGLSCRCGMSCLSGPGGLSCHRVLSWLSGPGGLLIPPHFPREIFFGGIRVPAVGAGPRGSRPRAPKTICHGLQSSQLRHGPQSSHVRHGPQSSQLRHGPQSSQLQHGLQSSLHRHGFQSSQLRHGPCLSVLLWRSPSCVPVCVCPEGPPERPPPLPDGTVKAERSLSGGGSYVSPLSCVSCVPTSCFLIWFVSCPCLMSLLVHSCPAVFV